jgi:hypothetical protein
MRAQGLQAFASQVRASFDSIKAGFLLGNAYDAGSVTWSQARAALTSQPVGASNEQAVHTGRADQTERVAA